LTTALDLEGAPISSAQRKGRETNLKHHRLADDLLASLQITRKERLSLRRRDPSNLISLTIVMLRSHPNVLMV
jgi:hypothetical protein